MKRWVLPLIALLPTALPAQTAEERLAAARAALEPFDAYFVREGGRWTSPNPDHEPGSDQPTHYGLHFERKLDGWGITTRVFGIGEDGSEIDYWEIVMAWSVDEQGIVAYQFGRGGALLAGGGSANADGTLEMELHGHDWSGAPFGYRDVFRIRGPDEFVIDAYHPDETGALTRMTTNTWTRADPS